MITLGIPNSLHLANWKTRICSSHPDCLPRLFQTDSAT